MRTAFLIRQTRCLGLMGLIVLCFSLQGFAQQVTVEATVDRTIVELGSSLRLTLTVNGTQDATPPELPDIPDVQSRYLGPSTRVSIINGQYSGSIAFNYYLFPLKTGQFQIPAVTMTIDGRDYATQPIAIQVVNAGQSGTGAAAPGGAQSEETVNLQDKIFLVMGTPRREYYLNEKIPVTIKLFVTGLSVDEQSIQYPEFAHAGFTAEDFREARRYPQVIGGVRYTVIEFKTSVYPTRTGDLTLGPAKEVCGIVVQQQGRRRRAFGDFGSIFDDDFFDGFFGAYTTQPVTLESADLAVRVLPLPDEGRPEGFSGAVGQFDFDVSVSPQQVKTGDPLTLRMTISGEGNLKAAVFPEVKDGKEFKTYDPQVKDEPGRKILEQVVIPQTDKVREFPALDFSYFDTAKKQYQTLRRGPFPLTVTPLEKGEELKVVAPAASATPPPRIEETFGQDIGFIKERPGRFVPAGYRVYRGVPFWICVLGAVFVWLAFYLRFRITHRIKTDIRFARRLQAPRAARRGLVAAKGLLARGEQGAFYDAVFKTLQQYFGNKFHIPAGVITLESIAQVIAAKGMKETILEKIKSVFEECEAVRYAAARQDREKMTAVYRQAEEIIDFFERNW